MTKTTVKINDTICKIIYTLFKLSGKTVFGFEKANEAIGSNFGYDDKNGRGQILEFNKPLRFVVKEL